MTTKNFYPQEEGRIIFVYLDDEGVPFRDAISGAEGWTEEQIEAEADKRYANYQNLIQNSEEPEPLPLEEQIANLEAEEQSLKDALADVAGRKALAELELDQ